MGFFTTPLPTFLSALALRLLLLLYSYIQDTYSPLKYTDIDYFVFTDATRFLSRSLSPYTRDTYRYTPLLAWLLYPTTFQPQALWFNFGKILFASSDIVAGYLIWRVLEKDGMGRERALKFAGIWLLNPMVAQISTRGSSEGLLCVIVVGMLASVKVGRIRVAGALLGLSVHLKIYPFVYAGSLVWWVDRERMGRRVEDEREQTVLEKVMGFVTRERVQLAVWSFVTFAMLSVGMYILYGPEFVHHTYLYHLTRIDHRHNFSPYNTLLYLNSSPAGSSSFPLESLAFIPQLLLSTILIPLILAKKDLASTLLAQTFAFVTFNKVCTSQYFLWYLIFLPFYLPDSTLLQKPRLGFTVGGLWAVGQVVWLQQGYQLEFLGRSTFAPGLFVAGIAFYFVNIWILGIVITDIGRKGQGSQRIEKKVQ